MNLMQAHVLGRMLMDQHGLKDWRLDFDRAKRRFGCCKFNKKVISLSAPLAELNSEEQVRDTILHEIAHALCEVGVGHGRIFMLKCVEIGCTPKRTYGKEVCVPNAKYRVICPECSKEWKVNKRYKRGSWHRKCHKELGKKCRYVIYKENKGGDEKC